MVLEKKKLMKKCKKCKEIKDLDQFYKRSDTKDKLQSWCKKCDNSNRLHRRRHSPELRQIDNMQRMNRLLFQKYGITRDQYNDLFNKQNGKCAICGREQKELNSALAVDHCHKTGKVRGLLCGNCNASLGLLFESLQTIENLKQYVINVCRTT